MRPPLVIATSAIVAIAALAGGWLLLSGPVGPARDGRDHRRAPLTRPRWAARLVKLDGSGHREEMRVVTGLRDAVNRGDGEDHLLVAPATPGQPPAGGSVGAGPVPYGHGGFALVRELPDGLDLLIGGPDGIVARDIPLAQGPLLATSSLAVGHGGEIAVSWFACRRPPSGCMADHVAHLDNELRMTIVSPEGQRGPIVTLSADVGSAINDGLAFDGRGELLAAYASGHRIVTRIRPPGGTFSRPTQVGRYEEGVTIAAGIDARGGSVVAWSVHPCGEVCGPVRVRAASRPAGAAAYGAVQTLEAPPSDDFSNSDGGGTVDARVAADGRAVVAWSSYTGLHLTTGRIGRRFGRDQLLTRDPFAASSLSVAPDGQAFVAWRTRESLGARVRLGGAGAFGPAEALPAAGRGALLTGFDPATGRPVVAQLLGRRLTIITRAG